MASLKLLLKKKNERAMRHGLILYLESLSLHLAAGFEMRYAWDETFAALKNEFPVDLVALLEIRTGEGMQDVFQRLTDTYPTSAHRLWFSVLLELYQSGAGMVEVVKSVAETLRSEQANDLETHVRNLPTLMNIILILFFFPPTLLLVFAPLLFELTHLF